MPKTKHRLSKRVFQFPSGVEDSIIKGVKCQEFVLTEQDPKVVTQLLKILEIPPCPISHRDWTRLGPKERGLIFDDREDAGAIPVHFVKILPGNGYIPVKPMSGA